MLASGDGILEQEYELERRQMCIKCLSFLALILVILGLAVLIAETMRSLVVSYQTVTHSIKWIEHPKLYTAPGQQTRIDIIR